MSYLADCDSPSNTAQQSAEMPVEVAIADIDSYSMLFYGHYLRYNERAANRCLATGSAVLRRVLLAKYANSVRWNDDVRIRTTAMPAPEGAPSDEHSLLHEWVGLNSKVVYSALCCYTVRGASDGFTGALRAETKVLRRITAAQREAAMLFSAQGGGKSETFAVFPDMLSGTGTLSTPCVMDLFERQRTKLIGGQDELERLKAAEGTMIVVYSIQQLELPPTPVQPRDEIEAASAFTIEGDGRFFCVKQSVTHRATGAVCAEGYLKLVFVKDGAVVKAPAATLSRLGAV